jgi:hypothetical protein
MVPPSRRPLRRPEGKPDVLTRESPDSASIPDRENATAPMTATAAATVHQEQLGLGADGVVVSAMTLHVRSDACRAHPPGTDHFAEAVITGTAVAQFADQCKAAGPPSLAVAPLNGGSDRQVL